MKNVTNSICISVTKVLFLKIIIVIHNATEVLYVYITFQYLECSNNMYSSSTYDVIKLIIAKFPGVTYQALFLQHHCKYQHNEKGKQCS